MTEQEITKFYQALTALAEMFDKALTPTTQELYLAALGDLGFEAFQLACQRAAQECKFFPKPVELRELVQGTRTEQAEAAWAAFLRMLEEGAGQYHSAFVEDGALAGAIVRCWGGLTEAHASLRGLSPDEPMYASQRKAFISAYASALGEALSGRYFAGTFEIHNRAIGGRDGELKQPVIVCGKNGVARLQMPFDLRTGELVPAAKQALIAMDRAALRAFLPTKPRAELKAAPVEQEAVPMPDDVRQALHDLIRRRTVPHLQLVEGKEVA